MDFELGEQRLRLLVRHRGVYDDIVALVPVDGRRDAVFVPNLEGWKHDKPT